MESGLADKDKIEFEGSDDSMCDDGPGNGDVCNVPTDITESKDGGVIKEILKAGSGWEKPTTGDKVFVHYVGSLEDGSVFDSSRERGSTFSFILGQGQVIKGWDIAVATMKPGELSKVTIKSGYGYGEAGSPPKIPPNATLIFEIELFDWKMMDCTKKEDAGVRKRIITQGAGFSTPNDGATIEAHIVGKFGDRVFEERDISYAHGEPSEANICEGLDLAIGKMKLGEKALIFIRSEYAWGPNPPAGFNLPSNYEEVIYEVNLKRFEKVKEAWELTEEEKFAQAQMAKDKGTAYFKQNKLQLALKQYKRIPTLIGPFKSDGLSSSDEEDEQDIGQNDPDSVIPPKEKYAVLMAGHLNLAMVYLKLEQYPEVIKNINSAMKIDPNNCKGLYRRGLAYSGLKEYEKAIVDFEKLLQLEPDNLAAKNKLTIARHGLKVEKEKEKALFKNMISRYLASSGGDNTPSYDGKIDEVKFNEPPNEDSQSSVQEMN